MDTPKVQTRTTSKGINNSRNRNEQSGTERRRYQSTYGRSRNRTPAVPINLRVLAEQNAGGTNQPTGARGTERRRYQSTYGRSRNNSRDEMSVRRSRNSNSRDEMSVVDDLVSGGLRVVGAVLGSSGTCTSRTRPRRRPPRRSATRRAPRNPCWIARRSGRSSSSRCSRSASS